MLLSFPFLVVALIWGFGTFLFVANPEIQRRAIKTEGLSSPLVRSGGVSMRVLWTISKYKVGEGALWGEEEARKMLFKPLDMDAARITFDGQTCSNVVFEKRMVNAKEYLANVYRTTPQALGIEEELIEVIKTNCDLPGFAEYIRLKDARLIIHLNGVFFYFAPAVVY
jgi:hypothetical protein